MQTKPRKDLWVFWLRIKWIYDETVFTKRSPYCFIGCYFLELFDSVVPILESREQREMIFISFPLKRSLDVWVQFWWYSDRLSHLYIQVSILKYLEYHMYPELSHTCMILGSRDTCVTGLETETLNMISLVCPNASEAELREQSNRFHSVFFFPLCALWSWISPWITCIPSVFLPGGKAQVCRNISVMGWTENTDKLVHGLALCVSKNRTWCGDQDFQRCVSGSAYSSLGKYLRWSFSMNQQNGSYCPWKLLSLALLPVPVKGRTYPCLSCSCANGVEQNKKPVC